MDSISDRGRRLAKRNFMRRDEPGILSIAHAGRGRMPLQNVEGKACAPMSSEVILPQGTPTIPVKKQVRIRFPSSDPEKKSDVLEFTYTVDYVEMKALRELVRSIAARRWERAN